MKRTPVSTALGIAYPVLQAGMPWVSNPELVAAVSNAGGLGILHPTSGIEPGGAPIADLHAAVPYYGGAPPAAAPAWVSSQVKSSQVNAVHHPPVGS